MTAVNGAGQKRSRRTQAAAINGGLGDGGQETSCNGGRSSASSEEQVSDKQQEQDGEANDEEDDEDEDDGDDDDSEADDDDDDDDDGDEDDEDEDEEDEDEDEDEEGAGEEDEEDSPLKFFENLDPNWLKGRSRGLTPHQAPVASTSALDGRTPAASADDTEFYGAMIQMLTHVLGSSENVAWPNQQTPGSQLAPSPFTHPYSSPAYTPSNAAAPFPASSRSTVGSRSNINHKDTSNKTELSKLQPMIQELISRLRKDHQQHTHQPVGEQDLTALLQTLMQQQQNQQTKQGSQIQSSHSYAGSDYLLPQQGMIARTSSGRSMQRVHNADASFDFSHSDAFQPLQFADLDFEEEDEDDPDFNPDLNPDLPLPSAWSLAVRDVVASEESRAAAAAAAVVASHSGTPSGAQTPADVRRADTLRTVNLAPSGSIERLAPHASSANTGARRLSLEPHSGQSSRRPSYAQPSSAVHTASAPPARPAERVDRWSPVRFASTPAPEVADAGSGSHAAPSNHLMSPSGRPIRASRKRPASPTPASPPRSSRNEAPATPPAPPQEEAEDGEDAPKKRGRKTTLPPGEAARRRAQRNIEYQRRRREAKKAEESEQTETVVELKAEVRVLRAEIERLRDENATLRAQRELERLQRSRRV